MRCRSLGRSPWFLSIKQVRKKSSWSNPTTRQPGARTCGCWRRWQSPRSGRALPFALLGAWPILPLAGLELTALAIALYWVNWKLEYRHVIRLTDELITIDKGYFVPKRSWHFAREESALRVVPEHHHWQGPELSVHDRLSETRIGEFLNREETLELLGLLRQELRIRTHSRDSSLKV